MAPAIVHFLVGAALFLLLAAPAALRDGTSRHNLWLVAGGGLWGLIPDFHRFTPVFRAEWSGLHESRWADVFAFHRTLDLPLIDTLSIESTAASILLFLGAVIVFTFASTAGERSSQSVRPPRRVLVTRVVVTGYAVVITALVAGIVVGGVFTETGRIESLAALSGREGARAGWALLLTLSLAATGSFAILTAIVSTKWDAMNPVLGALLGLLFAVAAWSAIVTVALPVWMRVVLDLWRPIPYFHLTSLLGLAVFGVVLGIIYPLAWQLVAPPLLDDSRS